ncbi:hypothetical protein, conserved [Eimeria maxima]|uniref:Uncharacterized protein n=1 Tax=Eimeria maxima TaxID=5804 RepID=U6MAD0_EIMMA|nr:hypothetical protein, conserved [Eimeria maxima]CDJ58595.1 hypothetical protein, conserved [Eimeria maxima]
MQRHRKSPSVLSCLKVTLCMQQQLLLLSLLLLQLLLRCNAKQNPTPNPWELPIPSDEDLLAVLSPASSSVQRGTVWGGPEGSLSSSRGYRGPPKLTRTDLFSLCTREFLQTRALVDRSLSPRQQGPQTRGTRWDPRRGPPGQAAPKSSPGGAPEGVPQEEGIGVSGNSVFVSLEVVKDLLRVQDILNEQLVARELLRLKKKAKEEEVSPRAVSFMLPVLLQLWGWHKEQKQSFKFPNRPPPSIQVHKEGPPPPWGLRRYRRPLRYLSFSCLLINVPPNLLLQTLLSLVEDREDQSPPSNQQQQQQQQRAAGSLLGPRCPPVSFIWAHIMGAAAAAGGPLEDYLRKESRLYADRALSAAKEATQLQILQAHAAATEAAAAAAAATRAAAAAAHQASPAAAAGSSATVSPLLMEEQQKGDNGRQGEALSPEELQEKVDAAAERRQKALNDARYVAKETENIQKRKMQLLLISPVDVCLASLAAI